MKTKSFLVISVGATALLSAYPALSQPVSNAAEADLIGLQQSCDGGDRDACIRFGFILGENRPYWSQWQQLHPDWWAWDTAAGAQAGAQVASITEAPPELPVYEQPPIPGPGYIWTPGYWDYGAEGYYWVPGTWVLPPAVGLLWTPGYWGWQNGVYVWSAGYWGPRIGFYGGVNYGFGYDGAGYEGGRWDNGVFLYNRTVNNFGSARIANAYSEPVHPRTDVRVSFNGGRGGISVRPTPQEEAFAHERHTPPTTEQSHHRQAASTNRSLLASENHGHPAIAATAKPGVFSGPGVVPAREAGKAPAGEPP
ncbi:MAG: YXWGXW repeat-containing protein, partial [Xanthobacteraceae bacterium]